MIEIHPERCVHQQCAVASCQACVEHCHRQAWRMHADGLGFDADLCDGCGLCVAQCPADAISMPAPVPQLRKNAQGQLHAWLACSRVAGAAAGQAGSVACLHALSAQWLDQLEQAGVSQLHHASADCASCPLAAHVPRPDWAARWQQMHARTGRTPALQLQACTETAWQQAVRGTVPDAGKRRFFGRLLQGPLQVMGEQPVLSHVALHGDRHYRLAQLARAPAGARALWAVALNAQACTWCMACVRLCPEQAIRCNQHDATGVQLVLDMQRCVGCGICVDVCEPHALQPLAASADVEMRQIPLQRQHCTRCKAPFLQLQEAAADAICPTCQQGRPQQYNRLVQSG